MANSLLKKNMRVGSEGLGEGRGNGMLARR